MKPKLLKRYRTASEYRMPCGARVIYSGTPEECKALAFAEAKTAQATQTKKS